jgi:hypothetical protein
MWLIQGYLDVVYFPARHSRAIAHNKGIKIFLLIKSKLFLIFMVLGITHWQKKQTMKCEF